MDLRDRIEQAVLMTSAAAVYAYEQLRYGAAFDVTGRRHRDDPYAAFRRLRERDPIHRSVLAPGWVFSRYDDVLAALGDARLSSDERLWVRYPMVVKRRRRLGLPEPYANGGASMLRLDPPDHTRLRRLVSRAFTPRSITALRDGIEHVALRLLDAADRDGGGDGSGDRLELVGQFAAPFPVIVIAEMLGVPAEDHVRFRHWSDEGVRVLGFPDVDDIRRSLKAQAELRAYLETIVEARRAAPRDDLVSILVAGEDGDRLTTDELFAQIMLLLIAGNETTTNLIGNGMLALLDHPGELERLRRQPELLPGAVDELLRYDGPVVFTSRMAPHDLELCGVPMARGEQVVLLLAAANRDPAAFHEPDRLDVARTGPRHLSFGHGTHHCLGAQLARLEGEIALRALLDRFPEIDLVPGSVVWGDNSILRGPRRLDLRVRRATSGPAEC